MTRDSSPLDRALGLAQRAPHDFTIQYPPRREYFMESFRAPDEDRGLARAAIAEARPLLLYCHVPFCAAKCHYCNFAVDTRARASLHARYVDALLRELETLDARLPAHAYIAGIDIGGGTPTLLSTAALDALLRALAPFRARSRARLPLSIETTPAIASAEPDKLARLVAGGVGRVSMGVQSSDDATLTALNRGGQAQRDTGLQGRALAHLRDAGFERVNIDLIFGLPGQSTAQWRRDLDFVLAAEPDSITTYDCLYRGKGRAITRARPGAAPQPRPTPARYAELYDLAYATLSSAGYRAPYGSVNFSRRPGETGTSAYFEGRLLDGLPYVGVGNYASSQVGPWWWFAPYKVDRWLAQVEGGEHLPMGDVYRLPVAERGAKQLLLALSFGVVDGLRFRRAHGVDLEEMVGPALRRAESRGWLVREGPQRWTLAEGQFAALPQLRALLYTEQATAWLEERGQPPTSPPPRPAGRLSLPML